MKALLAILILSSSLWAHDDDPKLLDRQAPYRGPGFSKAAGKKPVIQFNSEGVELFSWLTLADMDVNADAAADVWGYTAPSGREYAVICLTTGTAFVDVTFPSQAKLIHFEAGPYSIWRDAKVYRDYAYVVNETGGRIQIFDLRLIDLGLVEVKTSRFDGTLEDTHNVAINTESGMLYRCGGGNNGLRMYSLADPLNPTLVGAWQDKYVHDVQVVNWTEGDYAGKEIAFAAAGFNGGWDMTGLTILDVTDKSNPVEIVHFEYPFPAYSHQGWLSEDRHYFYLNDELDERTHGNQTKSFVIDISNLKAPVLVNTFTTGSTSIDHNLYVTNGKIYEANYRSGLHVFDVNEGYNPSRIAYFDTYQNDDAPNFNGLWSNYPFFASQIILGSDIEKGLFVWKLSPATEDLSQDGQVNSADVELLAESWGSCEGCLADLDQSNSVDAEDLARLLSHGTQN